MISLNHLKYFQDAAVLQSLTASAERNRVSTSAVSQAIRSLEAYFGVELLQHSRNRFTLTPDGASLLERSYELFAASQSLEEGLKRGQKKGAGKVSFATQQSIANHLLPQFMANMQQSYPDLQIQIKLATTDTVKTWLQTNEVEFGISVDNVDQDEFVSVPIYKGKFILIESTKFKAKARQHKRFITPGATTREARAFCKHYLARFNEPPVIQMDVKSWGVVKRFAELGIGTGFVPDYLIRCDTQSDTLRIVDIGLPAVEYSINAFYYDKRVKLSKNCRLFLDSLDAFVKAL